MDVISLIVNAFGVMFVVFSIVSLIKRRINFVAFLVWLIIGLSMIVISLFPFETSEVLRSIGVIAPFNALVIIGFVILMSMMLLMYKRLLKIEEKLIKVVRKEALRHFKEEKQKGDKED